MKTIDFYRQARVDGGERTGVEVNGETVLEQFEPGDKEEDAALLWFVDVRCAGDSLPGEAEAVREWLLEKGSIIQTRLREIANELPAGIDFSEPISRDVPDVGRGVSIKIFCSAIRRLHARDMAKALSEASAQLAELLQKLEVMEPIGR